MDKNSSATHVAYIDIAKGIGIAFVLLGHILPGESFVKSAIYSFHMPLFFIVSGMVMKQYMFGERIKRRIQTILIPYILWALIFASFSFKNIAYILYGTNETLIRAGSNGMLWFLVCMFFAAILGGQLFSVISKAGESRQKFLITGITAGTVLLSWVLNMFHKKVQIGGDIAGLPWALDVSILAAAFVLIGKMISLYIKPFYEKWSVWLRVLLGIFMLAFSIVGIFEQNEKGYSQMATYDIGNPVLYLVIACISCTGMIILSSVIEKFRISHVLASLGKHSMLIFIMHRTVVYYCRDFYMEHNNIFVGVIMWLVLLVYSYLAAVIIEYFCPILAGKKEKKVSK